MSRRIFIPAKRIWERRAFWWEDHYQKRAQGKICTQAQARIVLNACEQMPEPMLNIDGELDDWNYHADRAKPIGETLALVERCGINFAMLVKWYWSDEHWQTFVTAFNSLPEPEPVYELTMDEGYPRLEVVPYMLWISRVQLGTTPELYHSQSLKR